MYQRTKRRVLTFLSLAFMATIVLLCATFMPNTRSAKATVATPTNLKVDALGFLRWDAVPDATGYEWSYSTNGETYVTGGTCNGTEADVSAAITKAVELERNDGDTETSATLYLKVKAENGEDSEACVHTFDKYINYGYSTHDIADVDISLANGKTGNVLANSALYTNQLLSFGLSFSLKRDTTATPQVKPYYMLCLLNEGKTDYTQYYYRISLEQHGWINIYRKGVSAALYGANTGGELPIGQTSYYSIGVFDTRNVSDGTVVGETLYLNRTDIENNEPVFNCSASCFIDSTASSDRPTFTTTTNIPKNHTAVNNLTADYEGEGADRTMVADTQKGTVPKDSLYTVTNDSGAVLKSGRIPASSGIEAPTMAHYDSITGQVKWNKVESATAYKWSYAGKNDWTETPNAYIPADAVAAAIEAAKTSGAESVRFAIQAVNANSNSVTEYVGLDLTAFYRDNATLKDISDIHASLQNPSAFIETTNTNIDSGYAINTFVENAFTFDSTATNYQHRFVASMFATTGNFNGYSVSIHALGYITIATGTQANPASNNIYWRRPQALTFTPGETYIATYGVEELVNQEGVKVADRITVRISEEAEDGSRKVLAIVSYDNYEYNWTGVKLGTCTEEGTYNSKQINYHIVPWNSSVAYCKVSCATDVRDITYVADGVTHSNPATYTVGETLTFVEPTEVPEGYDFEGWYLDEACTQEAIVTSQTYNDLTVYAKLTKLPTITILDTNGNSVKTGWAENNKYTLPAYSDGVIAYDIGGELYKANETIDVESDITVKEVWLNFVMINGAWIRASSVDYYGGIRFAVTVDDKTMTEYAGKINIFGMIAPTDSLEGEFNCDNQAASKKELTKYSTEDGVRLYYITLTNVLYTNYNRAFSARAYVEINYESGADKVYTTYSEQHNSRSVYKLACDAVASGTLDEDAQAILANYLSYTVNVVATADGYSVAEGKDNLPSSIERKYSVDGYTLNLSGISDEIAEHLTKKSYVPVTIWDAEGNAERIVVAVEFNSEARTATATLPTVNQ